MVKAAPLTGRDALGRFLPGHPPWTHLVYRGTFPSRVRQLTKTLRTCLIQEKGGLDRISTGDLILIDKAISLLQVTAGIEKLVRQRGMFIDGRLDPLLAGDYLAYCREIRGYLKELDIHKKVEDIIDLTPSQMSDAILADLAKTRTTQGDEHDQG
jgi:hypothetical protein